MAGHELVFARISAESAADGLGRLSALHDLKRAELHIRVTGEALKALRFIWSALSRSPSAEVLLGRLTGRQTESPEAVHRRLTGARDELAAVGSYQYVVVNDDLEVAYTQVASIVDAETVRHRRVPLLEDRVRQLVDGLDREITKYARAL